MRNIEADLRERFDAVGVERQRLKEEYEARLRQIDEKWKALQILLFEEERLGQGTQAPLFSNGNGKRSANRNRSESANMILSIIADGRTWQRDAIVTEMQARKFPFGTKSPRRALHLALVNLNHADLVELSDKSVRRIKEAAET